MPAEARFVHSLFQILGCVFVKALGAFDVTVEARCDAASIFETAGHALDGVALFADDAVIIALDLTVFASVQIEAGRHGCRREDRVEQLSRANKFSHTRSTISLNAAEFVDAPQRLRMLACDNAPGDAPD